MAKPSLLEPSFADAVRAIEQATDLPPQKRAQWCSALRQIAKALEKRMQTLPARWTSARFGIDRLHPAVVGANAKTLSNQKANAKAALRWFNKEHDVPSRGVPLIPSWNALRRSIEDRGRKARLSGLMRYCSGRGIAPEAVDEATVDAYFSYRAQTTSLATDRAARRSIARAWNACADELKNWPPQRLVEPPLQVAQCLAWEDFPEGLRRDIDDYLGTLRKPHKGTNGKRYRACSPASIRTRRAELAAVARKAVGLGIPIDRLDSLAVLVSPDLVEKVIDAYWPKNEEEPKTFTIELASKLLSIARHAGLDAASIERLEEIRAVLEDYRRAGLTEKNQEVVRKVLTTGVWNRVFELPNQLMRQARDNRAHAPIKAALAAQIAVAIKILCFAPIRLANLAAIRIGTNLIRPGGNGSPYWLIFPNYDVKNRVPLEFDFDNDVTSLIEEYIHNFRPLLMRGHDSDFLFPGVDGTPKSASMFSGQVTERIDAATGLRLTVHQFRHAAGAIYLQQEPGNYEAVRRLLGHRNIQTTINFYVGLETIQANRVFGKIVRDKFTFKEDA
jgi:integrase